jgi:hypothetical protein
MIFQICEVGADLVRRHVRCRRSFQLEQTASPKKTKEARVPLSVMVPRGWPEMTGTTAGLQSRGSLAGLNPSAAIGCWP